MQKRMSQTAEGSALASKGGLDEPVANYDEYDPYVIIVLNQL